MQEIVLKNLIKDYRSNEACNTGFILSGGNVKSKG